MRLQADLEGRRMAEMRSLVPLDTPSLEDEVIVLEDDYDLSLQQQPNEIIDHTKSSPQQQHRRKKRLSDARQWVMQRIFKKNNNSSTKKHNEDDPNVDHETSSSPPPQRRPASITVQPQHHEDGLLENDQTKILSYEQYQHEKRALIGQGLSGLSNPNIARALGVPADDQHQASLASLLFSTSTSSSCTPPPSNSNPQQHHHVHCHSSTTPAATESQITTSASLSYQKRDSGVSVLSKPNQHHHHHHHRHQHHRHPTSSSITATTMMEDATRHRSRSNSKRRAQSMDSLVSVRYPKMVHVKVLRGAAIHALSSSDMSLATPPQPTDSIPDCCIMPDKSACCCSS